MESAAEAAASAPDAAVAHPASSVPAPTAPAAAWVVALGWGVLAEPWVPLLLGLAVFFWVAGFDIIYATQDADFDRASRGLIATHPTGVIESPFGAVWNLPRYDFIERGSENPDTVNPSLWRQAQLNAIHGLFEVAPGIWQARGYDISNVTFIAGETGWIVIDPLTSEPTARACLELADEHLGARPVVAVIYTHSHADHFGGVRAVVDPNAIPPIVAPEGFIKETVSEFLLAGNAMGRRASYQFGTALPLDPKGRVGSGILTSSAQ